MSIDRGYKISITDEVTVGCLEERSREGDSFLSRNFRDGLKFELVRAGYKVTSDGELNNAFLSSGIPYLRCLEENEIFALMASSSFDFFIQSYVQEVRVGDILNESLHTSVVLHLYVREGGGMQFGEVRYFGKGFSIKSNINLQRILEKIVQGLKGKDGS